MMRHWVIVVMLSALWAGGLLLSSLADDEKGLMQGYAVVLCIGAVTAIGTMLKGRSKSLLSCYLVVFGSPIWFLFLEAIFPNGDAWLLPANWVIRTLSYVAFFWLVFQLFYCFRMPIWAARWHERHFLKPLNRWVFPLCGVSFTVLLLFVIWGYYGFDAQVAVEAYLGGRTTGSGGLIKRGGIGGWEVFLQPFAFMAPVVPTLAALSWVRFGNERSAPLILRLLVTVCAGLLIFMMFLGGSRGNMAVYLAGPGAIWILFGRKLPKLAFYGITIGALLFLIGMWEFQMRKRSNLLEGISSFEDIVEQTTFDPTKTHRDNNLYLFTLNVMHMPDPYPFEGYSEFFMMLYNPIPRAIWAGKPRGIQESAETFREARGPASLGPIRLGTASLSSSIVSDGFKMHHYFGIALYAGIFGMMASLWDSIGQKRLLSSKLYFILNAAWLFWMLWSFRAAFAWITGMYSVWGAYLFCYVASNAANFLGLRGSHQRRAAVASRA